jgi:hypothetical protein
MTKMKIISAKHIYNYKIEIKFSDGNLQIIDFQEFLESSYQPAIKKYLDLDNFKQFKIIEGNLNWNDYDMIFPISDLYEGHI